MQFCTGYLNPIRKRSLSLQYYPNHESGQQGPRESKSAEAKPKRRCQAPPGDQSTGSPPPEEIPKLAQELLGPRHRSIPSRLKKLVVEVLRELLTFLETTGVHAASEFGEDEEEPDASAPDNDPEDVLPLCDDECPDLLCEDGLEKETKLQPDCKGPGRSGVRGVTLYRVGAYARYRASVGLKGIIALTQYCSSLDTIIDFHMSLVQMRHRFMKECEAGKPFGQALDLATEQLHREREGADAPKMRLSFLCPRVTGGRKSSLDEMKLVGQAYQEALAMGREEKLTRCSMCVQERAERKQERREAKHAAKHAAKVQALRTALQTELGRRAQQACGVKTLPQGIVLASLPGVRQPNTCLCLRP